MTRRSAALLAAVTLACPLGAAGERFLLVTDAGADRVLAINPFNGTRWEVSGPNRGTGAALRELEGVAFDEGNDEIFYGVSGNFDGDPAVVEVEWATGNRREISGDRGDGVSFDDPKQIVIIDAGDFAVVADDDLHILFAVDLDDGDRFIYCDDPALRRPRTLAREDDNHVLTNFRGDEDTNLRAGLDRCHGDGNFVEPIFTYFLSFTERGPTGLDLDRRGDIVSCYQDEPVILGIELDGPLGVVLDDFIISAGSNFDGPDEGSGPNFDDPNDLACLRADDSSDDRIYVADPGRISIIEVDPRDGDRLILSGEGNGSGPALVAPRAIALGRRVPEFTATDIVRHLTRADELSEGEQRDADLDDDGEITITDLVTYVNLGM